MIRGIESRKLIRWNTVAACMKYEGVLKELVGKL
jgi:hypothetical protein